MAERAGMKRKWQSGLEDSDDEVSPPFTEVSHDRSLPPEWRWQEEDEEQKGAIVPISRTSIEFELLAAGLRPYVPNATLVEVERVQNTQL